MASTVIVLAGFAVAAGWIETSASRASEPNLDAAVIKASQVGRGYRAQVIGDGRQVTGQVTLDLCGLSYASDRLRTARLEEGYFDDAHHPTIENEVVAYRPGGTLEALAELESAAKHCPSKPVTGPVAGSPPLSHRITRLSLPHLLPSYLAVRDDITGTVDGKRRTIATFDIYEFHNTVMSAIYAVGPDASAAESYAVHAAQESALNIG